LDLSRLPCSLLCCVLTLAPYQALSLFHSLPVSNFFKRCLVLVSAPVFAAPNMNALGEIKKEIHGEWKRRRKKGVLVSKSLVRVGCFCFRGRIKVGSTTPNQWRRLVGSRAFQKSVCRLVSFPLSNILRLPVMIVLPSLVP